MADQVSPKTPKTGAAAIAAVLVLIVLSFAAGYLTGFKRAEGIGSAAVQATKDKVKESLAESGLVPPTPEIKMVTGTITAIGTDFIEIDAAQTVMNPLEEPAPVRRRVQISADTVIVRSEAKPQEEFNKERIAFQKAQEKTRADMKTGQPIQTVSPPSPDKITVIELTDLKAGDVVEIASEKDIARAAEFTASEIRLSVKTPGLPTNQADVVNLGAAAVEPPGLQPPSMPPVTDPLR